VDRVNGTRRPVGLFLIRTVGPAPRVMGPPIRCPFCTSDRLLERLAGGWIPCNVCSKISREPD
jgi:ribosomal protein L37AE/L43A